MFAHPAQITPRPARQPRIAKLVAPAVALALLAASCLMPQVTEARSKKARKRGRSARPVLRIPARMPSLGPSKALVTIISISDFQCPFCSRAVPALAKLLKAYPNDVRVVFANNPLSFHDRAMPAAVAALAAHRQGRFWEMHDSLFANQRQLTDENFRLWAIQDGLDVRRFGKDLMDPALRKQIVREQRAAVALGARGTPSFFINGKLRSGVQSFVELKTAVDSALASARQLHASGKRGSAFLKAAFAAGDPVNGEKVALYFFSNAPIVSPTPSRPASTKPSRPPKDSYVVWNLPVDERNDDILGKSSRAAVTIVAYSDLECPFCNRGRKTLDQLRKKHGDKIRLVFRHHPLPFHRHAEAAHLAAIAASKQGKFWQMRDKLFDNQGLLKDVDLRRYAQQLGLDMKRFDRDRTAKAAKARLAADMESAGRVGVRGTPNYFFNGRKLVGAQPLAMMSAVVDEELKKAGRRRGPRYYAKLIAKGKVFAELDSKVHVFNTAGLPASGPKKAKVTVVLFADFQCPYCSRVATPIAALAARYPKRVRVVFAHYPLSFHKQARPAAWLAQHAYEKGGYPAYKKIAAKLYAEQRSLSPELLEQLAVRAGYKADVVRSGGKTYDAIIARSMVAGNKAGLRGTPTVYINGRKYEPGAGYTLAAMIKTISPML